ncbi:hypothetical protein LVY72_08065 [Arthrobacter sp. I2-34]|uniref:Uncharacterized protein n=1 Tax=Arthrobacter hankyongi TaxID=2904801 RepID=A0ABS9L5B3_9MICC|nr:hypothetical protein [Arthrobacter hankyongi]MCG2621872.1 hypothetical protein [Arthrobacter hankyongi]
MGPYTYKATCEAWRWTSIAQANMTGTCFKSGGKYYFYIYRFFYSS